MVTQPVSLTMPSVTAVVLQQTEPDPCELKGDYDLVEQVSVAAISMASCSAILSVIFPSSAISSMVLGHYTLPDPESRQFEYMDWVRAILLGIIGAFCGRTF
jgi:hypothetical protein